jgi:hypothetical protein
MGSAASVAPARPSAPAASPAADVFRNERRLKALIKVTALCLLV